MTVVDPMAMWEAADEEYYTKGYSEGEYCHKQSFIWGFQEGVDWLKKNYTITPKQK